jgi:hypothetical protein
MRLLGLSAIHGLGRAGTSCAGVVELADAGDLKSPGPERGRTGSTPVSGRKNAGGKVRGRRRRLPGRPAALALDFPPRGSPQRGTTFGREERRVDAVFQYLQRPGLVEDPR